MGEATSLRLRTPTSGQLEGVSVELVRKLTSTNGVHYPHYPDLMSLYTDMREEAPNAREATVGDEGTMR